MARLGGIVLWEKSKKRKALLFTSFSYFSFLAAVSLISAKMLAGPGSMDSFDANARVELARSDP